MKRLRVKDWPEGQRPCYTCNTFKSLSEFGTHTLTGMGKNSRCKVCAVIKSKLEYKESSHEYKMWYRAKRRAKAEGSPFSIKIGDILIPTVCPVFGKPLKILDVDWTPSLDRLNPGLGYVQGNVKVISNKANRYKNDATIDEINAILRYMKENGCG